MGPISELPVHPWMTCFNLRGHQRVRLHMSQTQEYVYDTQMRNKLVIDANSRLLIEMLLHQREQFKDVIAKKGGGAVILCAGPPGTGKTLTSEIFAESEKRPLYSVQCSQLGTSADQLEKSLLKIFARAQRWKAILLLDEADVYIAKRGSDMNQNAIVGVFLRVLEYYNGVMFMTTNRAESVDDAVLSRCVARIDYENPSKADQVKIWHILAATSGLTVGAGVAEEIASKYSLSGRDVKQILKLSGLVAYARKLTAIDAQVIEFCMRFKPTERIDGAKK
jgi:SpoVK/Ycf46/Vps4 family AAA+-type ATPase